MIKDIRYALRQLRKSPTFTVVAVLTFALGIGATSAIFSVMNATMLRPLPFTDSDRLFEIWELNSQTGRTRNLPGATRQALLAESQVLDGLAGAAELTEFTLAGERVNFQRVERDTLRLLGVEPMLGRWYEPDEALIGQPPTAATIVISHGVWQRHFGGDPDVLGQPLPGWDPEWGRIVIGVMPPGFWITPDRAHADAWHATGIGTNPWLRLKSGVSLEQARAELTSIAHGLNEGDPAAVNWSVELRPLDEAFADYLGYAQILYVLLGAVAFVLLIACANVVNLQLSRSASRQTEMATRAVLGAGRMRLVRQLLTENLVLALAGGGLGVLVALIGIQLFITLAPDFYPPTAEIRLDRTVLVFTLGISLTAGIVSGLMPALVASRPGLKTSLQRGGRGTTHGAGRRVRRVLVASEVALAMVLLIGAGLMVNSYVRVVTVDPGFDPDDTLTMEVALTGLRRYHVIHNIGNHVEVTPEVARFYDQVLAGIRALPQVESVGLTNSLPMTNRPGATFSIVGREQDELPRGQFSEIGGDYFQAMRIPLLRGRFFSEQDAAGAPGVVIVSQALARQYFPGEDPLGQRLQINMTDRNPELETDRVREIVGVVGDILPHMKMDQMPPSLYIPYQQHLWDYAGYQGLGFAMHVRKGFAMRTNANPMALAPAVAATVQDVDPAVAVDDMMSMRTRLATAAANEAFMMKLLGTFAALGVFLAAIGIYGVISYAVVQRREEFGVRSAFGAGRSDILRLVVGEGLRITLIGLVLGFGAALALTRLIESRVWGVTPTDPMTYALVSLVLIAVALIASYIPARRATKTEPMSALRLE